MYTPRNRKKCSIIFLAIAILFSGFSLTGCLDKNEIDTLAFVVALGVDIVNDNEIMVSVQIVEPENRAKTTGEKSQPKANVYVSTGSTIYDALFNLSAGLNKLIKFSNEKCIILGEKFAEAGIKPVLDFSLRYFDMRPTTPILVAKGKAVDILKTQISEDPVSAFVIHDIVKRQKDIGYTAVTTNLDFANNMSSESSGVTACSLINTGKDDSSKDCLVISGSAVFRSDKLMGYLDAKETRGMQWVRGKVRLGTLVIEPFDKNKISLHITKSGTSLTPSVKDKKVSVSVNVKAFSNIKEIFHNIPVKDSFNSEPNIIDLLSKEQDAAITNEINSAITAAQSKLSADIFDFGSLLYREYPHEWESIKNEWETLFPGIDIKVNVSSQIKQIGELSKTIPDCIR